MAALRKGRYASTAMTLRAHSLEGKVALVTGGGRGIGKAIAIALAARGVAVVVAGRTERALGETVGEIVYGGGKARHLKGDVRSASFAEEAVRKAVETFDGLDIVVLAAGGGPAAGSEASGGMAMGGDLAGPDALLQTQVLGAYYTLNAAIPHLRAGCSVLAIASDRATAASRASQGAVRALTEHLGAELAARGIACNALCPRETVTPEEVAEVALFLCGPGGPTIRGQALVVDGAPTLPKPGFGP